MSKLTKKRVIAIRYGLEQGRKDAQGYGAGRPSSSFPYFCFYPNNGKVSVMIDGKRKYLSFGLFSRAWNSAYEKEFKKIEARADFAELSWNRALVLGYIKKRWLIDETGAKKLFYEDTRESRVD